MSLFLWLACAALLLLGAGLEMWRRAALRAQHQATRAFIERQVAANVPSREAGAQAGPTWRARQQARPWEGFFERAGVLPSPGFYAQWLIPAAVVAALALLIGGVLSAAVALALYTLLVYFRFWFKAEKRYQVIVRQLPSFLDSMVRLLTVGNSLPAAFQTAAGNTEDPLAGLLQRAAAQVQAGMDLDMALVQVARVHRIDELFLFAAIVDLSTRFGGRADQILARMAAFMRDREQAQQELSSLSSETRVSAWVLALLPICVAGFLMVVNPGFFEPMLYTSSGQQMLLIGLGLELLGGFLLYRLAKSI